MGHKLFDFDTTRHAYFGFIGGSLLNKIRVHYLVNLLISNGLHLVIESLEQPRSPTGEILETTKNHLGDSIAFFTGWCLSQVIDIEPYIPNGVYVVFWIFLLLEIFKEMFREVYPYNNQLLLGAYHNQDWLELLATWITTESRHP